MAQPSSEAFLDGCEGTVSNWYWSPGITSSPIGGVSLTRGWLDNDFQSTQKEISDFLSADSASLCGSFLIMGCKTVDLNTGRVANELGISISWPGLDLNLSPGDSDDTSGRKN
jgi:hypothetical protein